MGVGHGGHFLCTLSALGLHHPSEAEAVGSLAQLYYVNYTFIPSGVPLPPTKVKSFIRP